MKASVVELRYKMKEILQALRRNEEVKILYHGKTAGTIVPVKKGTSGLHAADHPLFGMTKASRSRQAVDKAMEELRGRRYRDL